MILLVMLACAPPPLVEPLDCPHEGVWDVLEYGPYDVSAEGWTVHLSRRPDGCDTVLRLGARDELKLVDPLWDAGVWEYYGIHRERGDLGAILVERDGPWLHVVGPITACEDCDLLLQGR